jgi:hypothetical protein
MNFGFFLTPFPDNDPKSFPQEHELLEVASKEAASKLKEFKIRPRTFLSSLSSFDRNVISGVKTAVEIYVSNASEEVKQASPLISQFVGDDSESALFAYASAVSFVCMKKYSETIEFKKRMDEKERTGNEPRREKKRKH